MHLIIRPATPQNVSELMALSIAHSQVGFVETVCECLTEAAALPLWRPVGLYDQHTAVGFAMYGLFPNEGARGRVWLDRLMIDYHFQGRGLGDTALRLLLARLRAEYQADEIFLSIFRGNDAARTLYEKHGFHFNGELDTHGEQVMVKQC